jgi:hypothetical protein
LSAFCQSATLAALHFAWQVKNRKYMEYVAMKKEVSVSSPTKGSDSLNINIHYANEAHPSIVECH